LNTPAILQSTETPHSPIIDTVEKDDMKIVVVSIIKLRLISAIPIMCQIIQTIGTLTKFKIIHGFPVRLQKKAFNSQQFIILIAANQTNVCCHAYDQQRL
jgi:hypothetical protein